MDNKTWDKVQETLKHLPLSLRLNYLHQLKKHVKDKKIKKEIEQQITKLSKQELDMKEWKRVGTPPPSAPRKQAVTEADDKEERIDPARLRETLSQLEETVGKDLTPQQNPLQDMGQSGDPKKYMEGGDFEYMNIEDYSKLENFDYGLQEEKHRSITGSQGHVGDYTPEFKQSEQVQEGRAVKSELLDGGLDDFNKTQDYSMSKKKKHH